MTSEVVAGQASLASWLGLAAFVGKGRESAPRGELQAHVDVHGQLKSSVCTVFNAELNRRRSGCQACALQFFR